MLTFLTAFILAFILSFTNKNKLSKNDIIFGILIGLPNYFSSKLVLMALDTLDAIVVYPVYSVGTLVTITIAGLVLFKEQLSRKKLFAIIMITISLCLLNL
jgi:multidrug transporter EmrE-like cation transporter